VDYHAEDEMEQEQEQEREREQEREQERVVALAHSFGNSGAISEPSGSLYLWGVREGRVWATLPGLSANVPTRYSFAGFPREHKVASVACGPRHTVVCLRELRQAQSSSSTGGVSFASLSPGGAGTGAAGGAGAWEGGAAPAELVLHQS
jgi:hypothetical protein